uniref:Superoxide dismutase [Cu-Zn] 2 (Fragments) n=1 Tax=Debaryomyces hansenii TaxID=4959 RepID=SODC2_DEBHN|nr:RecName: Full=Superoxide dismutase [Cu-Zn] 2 [Debaryomyces hansenii]
KAVAVLRGDSNVSGVVRFEQTHESEPTKIFIGQNSILALTVVVHAGTDDYGK